MWFDRIVTVIKYLIISLVFLFIFFFAAVNLPVSQRIITQKANNYFDSKKLPVQVEKITLLVTGRVGLKQPQIIVPSGDTLLNADQISVAIRITPLIFKKLKVKAVTINQATVSLRKDSISGALNLVSLFSPATNAPDAKSRSGRKWQIEAESVKLNNVRFSFVDDAGGIKVWQSVGRLFVKLNSLSLNDRSVDVSEIDMESVTGGVELMNDKAPDEKQAANEPSPWKFRLGNGDLKDIRFVLHQPDMKQRMEISLKRADISETTLTLADHTIMTAGIELQEPVAGIFSSPSKTTTDDLTGIESGAGFPGPWSIIGNNITISSGGVNKGEYAGDEKMIARSPMIQVADLNTAIQDLVLTERESNINIDRLSFTLGNGFELKKGKIAFHSDSTSKSLLEAAFETGSSMANVRLEAEDDLNSIISSFLSVPFSLTIDRTEISADDILRFIPDLKEKVSAETLINFKLAAVMNISGTAERMNLSNVELRTRSGATLKLKGEIANITSPAAATVNIDLSADNITRQRLTDLISIAGSSIDLPEFELLTLLGSFTGKVSEPDFHLSLKIDSGIITSEGSVDIPEKKYALNVGYSSLDIGKLAGINDLGKASGNIDLTGTGTSPLRIDAKGSISVDSVEYNGYTYRDISIEMDGIQGLIEYAIKATDPSLDLNLAGSADIRDSVIRGSISGFFNVDAGRLHLYKDLAVRGSVEGEADYVQGDLGLTVSLRNIMLLRDNTSETIDSFSLTINSTDSVVDADIESDFMNAAFHSAGSVADLSKVFSEGMGKGFAVIDSTIGNRVPFLTALPETSLSLHSTYDPFISLLVPDSIFGYDNIDLEFVRDTTGISRIDIGVKRFNAGGSSGSGATVHMEKTAEESLLMIKADSIRIDNIVLSNLVTEINIADDTALYSIQSGDMQGQPLYYIAGEAYKNYGKIETRSTEQVWIINGFRWNVSPGEFLVIDPVQRDFSAAMHWKADQRTIDIYGSKRDKLYFECRNVGLNMLLVPGMNTFGYEGELTGKISYDGNSKTELGIRMDSRQMKLADQLLGDFRITGDYLADTLGNIESDMMAELNDTSKLSLVLRSDKNASRQNVKADFSGIPLNIFEPLLSKYVSGLSGEVNGALVLDVKGGVPAIDGKIQIEETRLRVIPLNASFHLPDNQIIFEKNNITFTNFTVLDSLNKTLTLNGTISLRGPDDIIADLRVTSDRIQVMNTSAKDSPSFNGSILVNTNLHITGPVSSPTITGGVVLAEGTVVNYTYTEDLSVSETEKTVTFASLTEETDTLEAVRATLNSISRLPDIEASIEINPNSLFNFQITRGFDIGAEIRGGGFLTYSLNQNHMIDLSGSYEINQGSAVLKIPGWPRKDFVITPGSTLRWDGGIDNPDLNIETTTRVRGSYVNPVDGANREVDFLVNMRLSGRLSQLEILFDVTSKDQYLTSVFNSLSKDERMKQAINLLIFEMINLPSVQSSSDYVTQQINQFWESQLNQLTKSAIKGIDFSIGIDTFTGATAEGGEKTYTSFTYEVRKQMFHDRGSVMVSGRVNDNSPMSSQSSTVIENFIFEYSLDSARSKFLKVYRQQNYEDLLEGEVIKSGVGFIYRKNYDRLSDIWRRKTGDGRRKTED